MSSRPANNMNEQLVVHEPIIRIDFVSRLPVEVSAFNVQMEGHGFADWQTRAVVPGQAVVVEGGGSVATVVRVERR